MITKSIRCLTALLCAGVLGAGPALAQLRVGQWNITNYSSGRVADFQTALYGEYQGRKFAPDVLAVQELTSSSGVTNYLSILNTAPGSPGDWAAAPWIVPGNDTQSGFFYRTSKVQFLGATRFFKATSNTAFPPRDCIRYDVRPIGYSASAATLAIYSNHMKSGTDSASLARRLLEAQYIRTNAESLPADWQFVICGDFNVQASTQDAYVEMTVSKANNAGRAFDPIMRPGTWENSSSFKTIHTQEPSTQMDSRHDQILLCGQLRDGAGFDYIGSLTIPYSSTTWNDPNHSYRCWGNDGTTFDVPLNPATNTMVGPTIAQALVNSVNGNGHLPVMLDLKLPALMTVSTNFIDFGIVDQGASVSAPITVTNSGNTALWTAAGLADLKYSFTPSTGISAPVGTQVATPGNGTVSNITLNTSTPGIRSGTLTITGDTTETPTRVIQWQAIVVEKFGWTPPKKRRFQD
ncbi:MAG: endonuclease/exonuclease/phosphatase family protein [Chthonomonas sp.]|nr:endonuclease/exonuclease/phosphatase family protein [Chthonomonas sp.]